MDTPFPTAEEYSEQQALLPPLFKFDVKALQVLVKETYRNDVLLDVNDHCIRMSVFEGEYRWHQHPDSDECFLVVEGSLQVEVLGWETIELGAWQGIVVPAGTVHRTRAVGRTVNLTFERIAAKAVFIDEGIE